MTGRTPHTPVDPDELTEAQLLALPDSSPEIQSRRADILRKDTAEELAREEMGFFAGNRRLIAHSPQEIEQQRQREATRKRLAEQADMEFHERQQRLLKHLDEIDEEIDRRRKDIGRRAIRLKDGRTAYVDGDGFRDEQGRELAPDAAQEAAAARSTHPDAATWQEHREIEQEWADAQAIRKRVETARPQKDGQPPTDQLASAEVEIHEKLESRLGDIRKTVPDYGSADMSELSGLSAKFTQTAENKGIVSRETTHENAPQPKGLTV